MFPPHASTPCFCAHTLSPLVFLWMYLPCSHLRLTPPVTDQFPCPSQLHKSSFSKFHLLLLTTDFPLCWNNSFTPCCSSHLRRKLYSSRLIVSSYSSLLNPLQCWSSPSCLWNTLSHCQIHQPQLRLGFRFSAALNTGDQHFLPSHVFQPSCSSGSVPSSLADPYHLPNPLSVGGLLVSAPEPIPLASIHFLGDLISRLSVSPMY